MRSEIVSVGTELLLGSIVDTNAAYLGRELATLGIDNYFISAAGDNLGRLTDTLRRAWDRSDVVIVTGGLGPTEDDLTREAISALLDEPMVVQPELEQELRAFFTRRSVTMPERNVKQATLVRSARDIPNPVGTAPGWWVERDGRIIVCMPGVPSEMTRMWTVEVKPKLQDRSGGMVIYSRTLKVVGIGESSVEEMLGDLVRSTAPTVATYAKRDGIHVRLTTKAASPIEAETVIAPMEARIRDLLGLAVYGVDDETLAQGTVRLLDAQGLTLAIAESGTAGTITSELAAALPLERFAGSRILPEVTLDAAQAELLAGEIRLSVGADVCLCVVIERTRPEPPAFTVHMAIESDKGKRSAERAYNAAIEQVRQRSVNDALNLLRSALT